MRITTTTTASLLFCVVTYANAENIPISNCGEPAIEAEWRELVEEMGKISSAERRDAVAVNQKRHEICVQIESGDVTLDEGIALFEEERERWKERTRFRKRFQSADLISG